jgi:hypothetical protein
MTFEDELRQRFHRAGQAMPEASISWAETIGRARRSRRMFQVAIGLAVVVALVAGALSFAALTNRDPIPPVVPAPSSAPECSALREPAPPLADGPRLPGPVRTMRARIIEAALKCDYKALERLALEGSKVFTFSYGATRKDRPAKHWRSVEGASPKKFRDPLRRLVRLLGGAYTTREQRATPRAPEMTAYIWPAMSAKVRPTEADWEALQATGAFMPWEIARMKKTYKKYGITYLDYRLAILENGDWVYFVAGD